MAEALGLGVRDVPVSPKGLLPQLIEAHGAIRHAVPTDGALTVGY